ncbi:MAG: DNA-processing protein DprA [Sporomusaceae bacterium]|nr:DNA-processing protein DprA [Sporomusaceae bacterium]
MATLTIVPAGARRFPAALKSLPDCPEAVYISGSWQWLDTKPCVAVAGSRQPSSWGRDAAFTLGSRLAAAGWGVISGLALGVDTAAHQGVLAMGGLTGVTLPCGLNRLYPPENGPLAQQILDTGGFLLSEYPPDREPEPDFFRARDRLQSCLSAAVIVVETEVDGGTMHTARFALEQRRPLLVLRPPSPQPCNEGNRLLASWPQTQLADSVDSLLELLAARQKHSTMRRL